MNVFPSQSAPRILHGPTPFRVQLWHLQARASRTVEEELLPHLHVPGLEHRMAPDLEFPGPLLPPDNQVTVIVLPMPLRGVKVAVRQALGTISFTFPIWKVRACRRALLA